MSEQDPRNFEFSAETVNEIYELVKDVPERQIDNGAALDAKMIHLFSAASLVIGLTAFAFSGSTPGTRGDVTALLVLALAAYGASAYIAFQHLRPKRYKRVKFDAVWLYNWNLSKTEFQRTIIGKATEAFTHNRPILEGKAHTIRAMLFTLGAEVTLVALALIATRTG